jgi:uncharacterized protein YukE
VTDVLPGGRPEDLVPGEADGVERLAVRLDRFAAAAGDASARLTGLDTEHWSGQAAESFRVALAPVPRHLTRAAAALAEAARALAGYAAALRAAQDAASSAIRLVEQSTPDLLATDRETARRIVERARAEVAEAARAAVARLAEAAADVPSGSGVQRPGPLPAVRADDGTTVRAVSEYRLAHPDQYVAPLEDLTDTVHFGQDHHVGFASVGAGVPAPGPADWREWVGQGADRGVGRVAPGLLAALGTVSAGLLVGGGRLEQTALARVGLGEAELRRRRERYERPRDGTGVAGPARSGRLPGAETWRTRLSSGSPAGGTVRAWAGPDSNPPPRARGTEAVHLAPADHPVGGVVRRTGPPADERDPGPGGR